MQPNNLPTSCLKSVWSWIVFLILPILGFLALLGSLNVAVVVVPTRVFFLWNCPVTSDTTISNRESDVKFIRSQMRHELTRGKYLVVHGPNGIGKTCAIKTAAQNMRGIIFTDPIWPETNATDIVQIAFYSVAETHDNVKENALRIRSWYKFLTGDTITLVLNVITRGKNQGYAKIPAAARDLSEYGFRVIVDSSDGAFPFMDDTSKGQFYEMEPMSDDLLTSAESFQSLVEFLVEQDMLEVVLATCGGYPLIFDDLNEKLFQATEDKMTRINVVEVFVEKQIKDAITRRNQFIEEQPEAKAVLDKFKKSTTNQLEKVSTEKSLNLTNIDYKDILRVVERRTAKGLLDCLVPTSRSMSLVLHFDLDNDSLYSTIREKVLEEGKYREIKEKVKNRMKEQYREKKTNVKNEL